MSNELRTYTITCSPADFPGRYVVRGFTITPGTAIADLEPLAVVDDLDAARRAVPPSADVRMGRSPEDPLSVVETWI